MELKEISTFSFPLFDGVVPFCMSGSIKQEFCVSAKQLAQIFLLNYDTFDTDSFKFIQSTCNVPQLIPTKNLIPSAKVLYNNSKENHKQELCIDPILLPEISPTPPNICFISIKFAPSVTDEPNKSYSSFMAGLTNFGGFEIKIKQQGDRYWDIILADLSDLWLKQCKLEQSNTSDLNLNNFKDFHEVVMDVQITAFDWNNLIINNMNCIACSTASGKLIIFEMDSQYQETYFKPVHIQFTSNLKQSNVNVVKWFSWHDSIGKLNSFICTGDAMGNIHLYQLEYDEESGYAVCDVAKKLELWAYDDKLKVGDIHIEYNESFHFLIVTVPKGSHIITFLINEPDYNKAIPIIHYVDRFFVTG